MEENILLLWYSLLYALLLTPLSYALLLSQNLLIPLINKSWAENHPTEQVTSIYGHLEQSLSYGEYLKILWWITDPIDSISELFVENKSSGHPGIVTVRDSGVTVAGIVTANSFDGDGTNLTLGSIKNNKHYGVKKSESQFVGNMNCSTCFVFSLI